jgi:hypothetical protein
MLGSSASKAKARPHALVKTRLPQLPQEGRSAKDEAIAERTAGSPDSADRSVVHHWAFPHESSRVQTTLWSRDAQGVDMQPFGMDLKRRPLHPLWLAGVGAAEASKPISTGSATRTCWNCRTPLVAAILGPERRAWEASVCTTHPDWQHGRSAPTLGAGRADLPGYPRSPERVGGRAKRTRGAALALWAWRLN